MGVPPGPSPKIPKTAERPHLPPSPRSGDEDPHFVFHGSHPEKGDPGPRLQTLGSMLYVLGSSTRGLCKLDPSADGELRSAKVKRSNSRAGPALSDY